MKNFLRGLRYAWTYRGRLIISIICAVIAAAMWGLNFTAVYPVLKILGTGQSMQDWVDGRIQQRQEKIDRLHAKVDELTQLGKQIDKAPRSRERDNQKRKLASELASTESDLDDARTDLYRYS